MYSLIAAPEQTELPKIDYVPKQGACLQSDSRKVRSGDVFIACQGEYVDGRNYIPAAITQGASFVYWDDDGHFQWNPQWSIPNQGVKDLRRWAGILAALIYDKSGNAHPKPIVWGVTGTNGKTSITQWLAQAVDLLNGHCAIVGTVGNGFWNALQEATHTTPDPVSLQTLMHDFRKQGASHVAMEVSSHGLHQHRVNGVSFVSAVFTNLTRDHLDYHKSMDEYGSIKSRLFYWQGLQHAVINSDDVFGKQLVEDLRNSGNHTVVYTYGFNKHADIKITHFQASSQGMLIHLDTPWGKIDATANLLGRFNALNFAACVGILCANGYALVDVVGVLAKIRPATGRMDCIIRENKPLIVVDYAHTPDALEKALSTLREILPSGGKLWCVFGCGGNRDRGKRPLMGAVAAKGADKVVVTSDNPRMENPDTIIQDILPAVPNPALVEADRRLAIVEAVTRAGVSDIVLIAGKGHETYQDIQGTKHHFSDFEIAEAAFGRVLTESSRR